jgi:hypothetical protein
MHQAYHSKIILISGRCQLRIPACCIENNKAVEQNPAAFKQKLFLSQMP